MTQHQDAFGNPKAIRYPRAFTLIELLVVISVIAVLMGILMPALVISRAQSKKIACQSNLRQLVLANAAYADSHLGHYVPGTLDIYTDNTHRWYGVRENDNEPFDTAEGPLASYLGESGIACPTKVNYADLQPSEKLYDRGSGGYGYNMVYIGSTVWIDGYEEDSCRKTAKDTAIRKPAQTLMFADTAMANDGRYIEYSFAEPRFFVVKGEPTVESGWNPDPSIHFRHRNRANIGWADGHISDERIGDYDGYNEDGTRPADFDIGWFEPMNNTPFDLK